MPGKDANQFRARVSGGAHYSDSAHCHLAAFVNKWFNVSFNVSVDVGFILTGKYQSPALFSSHFVSTSHQQGP
jgi:hypothetical protein